MWRGDLRELTNSDGNFLNLSCIVRALVRCFFNLLLFFDEKLTKNE
jgi:hypothetical protein